MKQSTFFLRLWAAVVALAAATAFWPWASQAQTTETTQAPQRRVLVVVTNHADYPSRDDKTGLWFTELTHFWDVMAAQGIAMDIASPQGGPSPLDERSLGGFYLDGASKAHLKDPAFMARLRHTEVAASVDPTRYDAVYFTGGHRTMWDFRDSPSLKHLAEAVYRQRGVVSAVCHGNAALLQLQGSDGKPLVAGRRVTGFSNLEEWLSGVQNQVPFYLQDALVEAGAVFEKAFLPFTAHAVTDGRLVTGQNPQSSQAVAQRVLALIQAPDTLHKRLPKGAAAPVPPTEFASIRLADQDVPVVKGGLYDRYRSNPPLSVVAEEAPHLDLSWFKQLQKNKVDIGFETYSPNFFYDNSRVTAVFTADLAQLKSLMPAQVLDATPPVQVWPGRGLVALTAYAYHHCDNDRYNEIGLSVVTHRPGGSGLGPLALMGQASSGEFWGHVLKLPVNTELARVRGVVGYNLPKWLTRITYEETDAAVQVVIYDGETDQVDVVMETEKLTDVSRQEQWVTHRFTNLDHQGRLSTGHTVSRQLRHASSTRAGAMKLTLSDGGLSAYIKALKLGKMLRYEYVPAFQSALYAPTPL